MTCSLLPGLALRDATLRAAPQVSELVDLRWEQVDFNHAVLQVRRVKKGTPATHPIIGDEMRALRRLQREQAPVSPFVLTRPAVGALRRFVLVVSWPFAGLDLRVFASLVLPPVLDGRAISVPKGQEGHLIGSNHHSGRAGLA
jgi:integrase